MSQLILGLLALLILAAPAWAQPVPTWKNDALGRPAPPCMILDATTGISSPCSTSNPIPTSGGAGTGTTTGSSETGFGKAWFPSTITGAVAGGQQMIGLFIDDSTVVIFRRSTGCGNCLQVAVSQDGGVTGTFVDTSAILGNSIRSALRVPSSPPRYLVSNIGGPFNAFQSASLTSGWINIVGLANPLASFASNTTGSVVLASDAVTGEVCRSTNNGISFGSCVAAGGAGSLEFAGGTTWLLSTGTTLRRSTNDGASWATVHTSASNFTKAVCYAPGFTVCIVPDDGGSITRSINSGATWPSIVLTGIGSPSNPQACDYGGGNAAVINTRSAPIGFAAVTFDTFSSFNSGQSWFPGARYGSHWDGTGVPGGVITCRSGRGFVAISTSGGGTNVFAEYNPLTSPGGTLTSSAGGYNVSAPIQAGIILNTTPVASAANTAAAVTLTNTGGSRICIRRIEVFNTGAAGNFTVTVTDGATVVLNLGTLVMAAPPQPSIVREGAPLLCSQTSNNLVVNIGAGGAGAISTTSVIADRYPN